MHSLDEPLVIPLFLCFSEAVMRRTKTDYLFFGLTELCNTRIKQLAKAQSKYAVILKKLNLNSTYWYVYTIDKRLMYVEKNKNNRHRYL